MSKNRSEVKYPGVTATTIVLPSPISRRKSKRKPIQFYKEIHSFMSKIQLEREKSILSSPVRKLRFRSQNGLDEPGEFAFLELVQLDLTLHHRSSYKNDLRPRIEPNKRFVRLDVRQLGRRKC